MKISGSFCEQVKAPKSTFDKRSFRWVKQGKHRVMIGCPKGKWKSRKQRCAVGTRAHVVLVKTTGACKIGKKIRKG